MLGTAAAAGYPFGAIARGPLRYIVYADEA
jgi:hypothetical protein